MCVCVCVCSFQASFVSVSIGQKMFNEIQTYICTPAPHFPYWNEARTERAHVQEEELEMIQNNVRNRQNQLLFS